MSHSFTPSRDHPVGKQQTKYILLPLTGHWPFPVKGSSASQVPGFGRSHLTQSLTSSLAMESTAFSSLMLHVPAQLSLGLLLAKLPHQKHTEREGCSWQLGLSWGGILWHMALPGVKGKWWWGQHVGVYWWHVEDLGSSSRARLKQWVQPDSERQSLQGLDPKHRITGWQGWKVPPEVKTPVQSRVSYEVRPDYSWLYPVWFWKPERMDTEQSLWETCYSAWHFSQSRSFSWPSVWAILVSLLPHSKSTISL